MASDRYLKAVLTIIAACLVYICVALSNWPPAASAQGVQEVVIVGWRGTDRSGTRSYNLPAISTSPTSSFPVIER